MCSGTSTLSTTAKDLASPQVLLLLLLLLLRVPFSRQPFVLTSFVRCVVVSGTGPAQAAVVVQVEMAGLGCPSLA